MTEAMRVTSGILIILLVVIWSAVGVGWINHQLTPTQTIDDCHICTSKAALAEEIAKRPRYFQPEMAEYINSRCATCENPRDLRDPLSRPVP